METAEQMLRRFKKACEKEGLTKDIKRIAYYEKPSEKRRRRIRSKPKLKPWVAKSMAPADNLAVRIDHLSKVYKDFWGRDKVCAPLTI